MIRQTEPSFIELEGFDGVYDDLKKFLTYKDKSIKHEIDRFKHSYWYVNKFGREAFEEKLQELKDSENQCLLIEEKGVLKTYAGLLTQIQQRYPELCEKIELIEPPKPKGNIPWDKKPFELRDYQEIALKKLLAKNHAAVSIVTGGGKSLIILCLCKALGLKTVVMAPSVSIAEQLYDLFIEHFGSRYVGMYGDGKKKTNKLFTIGIAQSLTKVKEGSKEMADFAKADVFIVDESHLVAADTLERVCLEVVPNAAYRYFFSATQMRNDGADMLLDGIIGDVVHEVSAEELIAKGVLAKPNFLVFSAYSTSNFTSQDTLKMLSNHLYNNADLHKKVAEMANKSVELFGHKVLIMIDQVTQFRYLYPYLKFKTGFAHGGVTKETKETVPPQFHKSDPNELVREFNYGDIQILVGTSCVGTGTDFKTVNTIYNLQGGKSEVKFKQLVGRGTRVTPTKTEFFFCDFDIANIPNLHFHAIERSRIYKDVYDNVKWIK